MKVNVIELAGYVNEVYVWQLLRDVAKCVSEGRMVSTITPYYIMWDGESFILTTAENTAKATEKDLVWQLAATAFHAFMGCPVFNGKGQQGQHADSPLPYMRKSMPELSNLVCQMLSYQETLRPAMADVQKTAEANLERLRTRQSVRQKRIENSNGNNNLKDFWPDEME